MSYRPCCRSHVIRGHKFEICRHGGGEINYKIEYQHQGSRLLCGSVTQIGQVDGAHKRIGKNHSMRPFGSLIATEAELITATGVLCRKDAAAGWPACQNGAIKKADLRSAELTAEARSAFSISPHMFSTKHTGGSRTFYPRAVGTTDSHCKSCEPASNLRGWADLDH